MALSLTKLGKTIGTSAFGENINNSVLNRFKADGSTNLELKGGIRISYELNVWSLFSQFRDRSNIKCTSDCVMIHCRKKI